MAIVMLATACGIMQAQTLAEAIDQSTRTFTSSGNLNPPM
jgi:hypothetical protein